MCCLLFRTVLIPGVCSMALLLLRRIDFLRSSTTLNLSNLSSLSCRFSSSRASAFLGHDKVHSVTDGLHLSPLFSENTKDGIKDCKIELVDDARWHVSSSLADAWRVDNENNAFKMAPYPGFSDQDDADDDYEVDGSVNSMEDPDFDDIEDMRVHRKLFYKLEKDSKEYEEYKFDFHRKKSSKNEKNPKENKEEKKMKKEKIPSPKVEVPPKIRELPLLRFEKNETLIISRLHELGDSKKQRTPTFNQQTAPYHEPFCLDIFISKGSVRASIIHRATSNVVAVSHSISKDMKFELGSTKNRSACAAVGKVLAQRALDDDIHNVVYTPRKGDRVEGKIQIVLKSIVDGGVDVKVKLKQKQMGRKRESFAEK